MLCCEALVWMQGFGQFEPVSMDAFERFLEGDLGEAEQARLERRVCGTKLAFAAAARVTAFSAAASSI